MGAPRWHLTLCLLLAWIIVFLCIIKGIKSAGKVCEKAKCCSVLLSSPSRLVIKNTAKGLKRYHNIKSPNNTIKHKNVKKESK